MTTSNISIMSFCKQGERSLLAFCLQHCAMTTIKSRQLTSTQETMIFLDPFALFFATKHGRGTSEFAALCSPQAQSPALCFADKTSWSMGLQLLSSSMLSRLPKTQRTCLQNFVISLLNLLSKYIFHGQI